MFNRTVIMPTLTEYVDRNVTVNRAPTDESVKLLKEFEEKAQQKIDKSLRIEDNRFDLVVHALRSFADDSTKVRAIFSLNGKQMSSDISVSRLKLERIGMQGVAKEIVEEIAMTIVRESLGHVTTQIMGAFNV